MCLVIPWGVFARYVLGTGSQWPEPVAILLMMVFTFFGAAVTYRAAGHIAVEMLDRWRCRRAGERAPGGRRRPPDAGAFRLHGALGHQAGAPRRWARRSSDLPWLPVGVSYLPLPLGSLVTIAVHAREDGVRLAARAPDLRLEHQADEIPVTAAEL